jgi:hypothetical protein
MEPLSTALIAILIPSLAVALNLGIKHLMRDKKKTIFISKPYGQDEAIRVGALADDAKVLNIVRRTIGFEDDVFKAIQHIAEEVSGLNVRRDQFFDFVVEYKDHRFAVECKYNLGRSSASNLYKLLENAKDLEKLFVITRQHMKSQQIEKSNMESSSNKIDFISIGSDADMEGTLNSLIRREIDLPITA